MQNYIDQIVEDLNTLMQVPPPFEKYKEPDDFDRMMMDLETAFLHGDGIAANVYTKISKEELPPPEQLNEEQIQLLTEAVMNFLTHCQYFPEFPDKLPVEIMYKTLRDNWEKFILPEVPVCCHQEFCDYDREKCPFPGYCSNCDETDMDIISSSEPEDPAIDLIEGSAFRKERNEALILEYKNHFLEVLKIMDQGENIAGIYNYCNQWCKKCRFQGKCSIFQLWRGLEKENFWIKNISNNKERIFGLLQVMWDLHEGQLEKRVQESTPHSMIRELFEEILPDLTVELVNMANKYVDSTMGWLEEAEQYTGEDDEILKEKIEIIEVHHYLIYMRLKKADDGQMYLDEENCSFQNEVYGSVKVALISIRESKQAWQFVAEALPCQADFALARYKELQEMEDLISIRFPDAEKFVRPGFDEKISR